MIWIWELSSLDQFHPGYILPGALWVKKKMATIKEALKSLRNFPKLALNNLKPRVPKVIIETDAEKNIVRVAWAHQNVDSAFL